MARWLARLIVRCSAWLAPREVRARWTEEWLAEIENGPRSHFLVRVLGAPVDAVAARRLAFATRDRRRFRLSQWVNDTRYTVRLLLRSPGYVAIVVLGLGVGLTATIAMYSAANAAMHGELPGIEDRESLAIVDARLSGADRERTRHGISLNDLPLLQSHGPLIRSVAAQGHKGVTIRFGDDAVSVSAAFASDTLFETLGTTAVIGRLLSVDDERQQAAVAMVGYRFWQTHFGGRTDVLGQTIVIEGQPLRVVGVLPDRFAGLRTSWAAAHQPWIPQVWLPLALARSWPSPFPADVPTLSVGVRLAPQATREAAERDLVPIARTLAAAHQDQGPDRAASIRLVTFVIGDTADNPLELAGMFSLVLAIPLGVLAIASANVANLRLARATARASEWAVRLSLGATRGHLTRLLLIEATILTVLALFVAWIGVRVLITQLATRFFAASVTIDWRVATFGAFVAGAVIVLSGLAPAWLVTRRTSAAGMRQAAHGGISTHARARNTLVIIQVALSLVLLATGSLITRSAHFAAEARRPSFDRLLVADITFDASEQDASRFARFGSTLLDRLAADSRFAAVGLADSGLQGGRFVRLRSERSVDTRQPAHLLAVTPGWFDAMSLPTVAGRTLSAADADDVVVLNEAAARLVAPGQSPLGLVIDVQSPFDQSTIATVNVVGVVPDSTRRIRQPLESVPFVYRTLGRALPRRMTLFAREAGTSDLSTKLHRVIAGVDNPGPWTEVQRATAIVDEKAAAYRDMASAARIVGAVALALAAAGLFAVMGYTVSLRTREMGVRVALGAGRSDIARLVIRQALRLTSIGAIAGFAITLPLAQLLRSALLGVSPLDPVVILVIVVLFLVTALAAGALPARRAAAVDPVVALRTE